MTEPIYCNLGTGRGFSVKEIIATAEKVAGKKAPVQIWPATRGGCRRAVCRSFARQKVAGMGGQVQGSRGDHSLGVELVREKSEGVCEMKQTGAEIIGWILLVVSLVVGFGMTIFAPI